MIRRGVLGLLLLAGCAKQAALPSVFTTDWLNDGGHSIARVEQSLRNTPKPPTQPVAVGVTETTIVGIPLNGGARWSHTATPDTLPSIAGEFVLYSSRGKLTALDAKTGAARWNVDVGSYWLRGAGDDGKSTVVSLGTSDRKKSLLLAVRHDGGVQLRLETPLQLGRPAARGGVAFVPWAGQYVSAIDIQSGDELGRLLTRELVSHALNVDGELFFGEKAMLHLDERVRYASTNQGVRTMLPERVLPGRPRWLGSGSELPVIDLGAHAKVRLYAAPVWRDSETRFASDSFVASYFRTVMGFNAKNAELQWVRAVSSPVIGGAPSRSGFVLCGADGKAHVVSNRGSTVSSADLGSPLRACVVEASSLDSSAGEDPGPLAAQIDRALSTLDPEMAAAQAFLVSELGRLPDPSVTKTLIDLTTSSRMPPDVRLRARDLLSQRRSGAELMLAALERRYDFLSGELLPPPVGPLADALAAMNERRAAPLLARHLNDPSTDAADVARAAHALVTLATSAELPGLRTFFALYRATADEPALVQAVGSVAAALIRVGGSEGRALVERAAHDPLTQPDVVKELASVTESAREPARAAGSR
ncbi:MAG: PQQ-binding-like beta-propeller repeat protein [Myxococcota bacterium]